MTLSNSSSLRKQFVRLCRWASVSILMGCLSLCTPGYSSEGLYLLGIDALQLGRADSGAASPRSAAWMLINPAALTEFDRPRFDTTLYVVFEKIHVDPGGILGNPLDGGLNGDGFVQIPSFGYVQPIQDGDGAIAVGVYPIGGGAVEYDNSRSSLGRILFGNSDRKLALQHIQVVGAYARDLGNGWSVGAGVQVSVTRLRTNQLTLNLRPADGDNGWDEAIGIGFNLGVFKKFGRVESTKEGKPDRYKYAVGAMYKSRQWAEAHDKYRDLLPESLDYPHTFRFGVAWMPHEKLTFTADYEYQRWSTVPPFGTEVLSSGLAWPDVHAYKAGVEWKAIQNKLTLMAGVSFNNTPVSSRNLVINQFIPTLIEQHYTAGVTWHINPANSVHLVYLRSAENSIRQGFEGDILSRLGLGTELTVSGDSIAVGYSRTF